MPHLVLPLSGCLSRRTPTRATRGEARGHRSALAQNSLLMLPPSFSFLWTCRRSGVSSPHGGLPPMCLRCCAPIVMPLPSLGHRRCCVAGLARGHPDSGEAAIMGVPLPHLVLPLSGYLSRHTPTRATLGGAREHRSVLAQNPLSMHPPCSFLWTCRRSGVSSPYDGLVPMCLRCCGYIPGWFRPMALLCGHVGR